MKNARTVLAAVAALVGGLCTSAQAGLIDIRIDLSTFQGSTGGNWNNISNLTGLTSNLIDFGSGAPTSVSINGLGSPWQSFFGDDAGEFPDQDWLIQPATVDGAGLQTGQTGSFEIAGLSGAAYQIEVVSARTSFDYQNTFTVDGALAGRTFLGTPVETPWGSTSDGLVPGNWLIWDAVMPVDGAITITDSVTDTLGILNAIRILEVTPAPGAAWLLGLAAVAGLGRRRR